MNQEEIKESMHQSAELSNFAENYNLKSSHRDTKSLSSISKYGDKDDKDNASIKIVDENHQDEKMMQNLDIPNQNIHEDVSDFNAAEEEFEILDVNSIGNFPAHFEEIKEMEIGNQQLEEQVEEIQENLELNQSSKEERLNNEHNSEGIIRMDYSKQDHSISHDSNKLKNSAENIELDESPQILQLEEEKIESPLSKEEASPQIEDSPKFKEFEDEADADADAEVNESPAAIKPVLIETPKKESIAEVDEEENNTNEISPYGFKFGEDRKSKSMFNLAGSYKQSKFRNRDNSPFRDLNTIRENENISENEDESGNNDDKNIPSEKESEDKSEFSSRNSYLEKEYKVKINDHESFDAIANKGKNFETLDISKSNKLESKASNDFKSSNIESYKKTLSSKEHSRSEKNSDNCSKYKNHDKLLSSKEQSIDNLNKNDVSVAERLEIEHTLSQLEQKYQLNSNTLKIEKIKPKKLKLYPKYIMNSDTVKKRQQTYPTMKEKTQTFYRPKTIQYDKRPKLKEGKAIPKNFHISHFTSNQLLERDEFSNYLNAVKTARDNISDFQK